MKLLSLSLGVGNRELISSQFCLDDRSLLNVSRAKFEADCRSPSQGRSCSTIDSGDSIAPLLFADVLGVVASKFSLASLRSKP